MSLTTLQKVTLISCSVLCVSLFLPKLLLSRGKKDVGQPDVRPGFYPPMMHRLPVPEDQAPWEKDPPDPRTHSAEVMAKVKGMGGASRTSLLGQVIPIYGFGIFLYILFIFYKMTSKGKPAKLEGDFASLPTANMRNTISEYELARLQRRLEHTEQLMETMVFGTSRAPDSVRRTKYRSKSKAKAKSKGRSKGLSRQQLQQKQEEEQLLRHLEQISRVMEEGCKEEEEGASPEMEAEEVPYTVDWEGYPAETYPQYAEPCAPRRYDTVLLEEPCSQLPTPEALAERMEVEVEEEELRLPVLLEEPEEEEEQGEEEQGEEEQGEKQPEEEEEEEEEEEQEQGERQPCLGIVEVRRELLPSPKVRRRITFSDHEDVFHYPKEGAFEEEESQTEEEEDDEEEEEEEEEGEEEDEEEEEEDEEEEDEEEDPLMEAESLRLDCDVCRNPEAEAEEELEDEEEEEEEECQLLCVPQGGGRLTQADLMKELGASGLRMRNRRET